MRSSFARLFGLVLGCLLVPSTSISAPPTGIAPRGATTETVAGKELLRLTLEGGYLYSEGDALDANLDAIPVLLRVQASPFLEIRGGAVTWRDREGGNWPVAWDTAVLLSALPATPVIPGVGIFARLGGETDNEQSPFIDNGEIRAVLSWSFLDAVILDTNLGYWIGAGNPVSCDVSDQSASCTAKSNHFVPALAALRFRLFDLLELYGESENYFSMEEFGDASTMMVNLGGVVTIAPSLRLDIGMGRSLQTAGPLLVTAGFAWDITSL